MLHRAVGTGRSTSGGALPVRRARAALLLAFGAFAMGGVLAVVAEATGPSTFAATASLTPQLRYINDSVGTTYTFTLKNTGTSKGIGAVQIARPSASWTISACPSGPSGWSIETSATRCRYRSGGSTADDIKPGQSRTLTLKAKTAAGNIDVAGTWAVTISGRNGFESHDDDDQPFKSASATGAGLTTTLNTYEVTDAVVADASRAPNTACPAPNKTAVVGSQKTIVICGKNHANVVLTPTSTRSTLGGTYIATPGTFLSAPISANSGNVVLADWNLTTVNGTYGTDYKVIAGIGSAVNRTSPIRTFTGYSATSRPPVAVDDTGRATSEDTALHEAAPGVLANDSDPDGDAIHVGSHTNPAHGTVVLNTDGSFDYTPNANYFGPDSFTYKANDGHSDSSSATVSITVTAVNDVPTVDNVTTSTNEDIAKAITLTSHDPDGAVPTFTTTTPGHGTLGSVSATDCTGAVCTATVTYTPAGNYNGPDSFTYKANDGLADSTSATVSITVNAVNDAPVANPDSYSTAEDTELDVVAPGVLDNDTDVESNPLTAVLVTNVTHGTLALHSNGSFEYTPAANYNGPDSFSYKANDGQADSAGAVTAVTINPVNDAPTADGASPTVAEDTPTAITLTGHDVDGDALTFEIVASPTHGGLGSLGTVSCGGTTCTVDVTYTPASNYAGPDSFTYKVSDGPADSSVATVSITVSPVNDAPVAVDNAYSTNEDTGLSVAATGILGNDTDTEGDTLTAVMDTSVTHGILVFNTDGSFNYTPSLNYHGPDSFTYHANDGAADSNVATVNLTVDAVNDAPTADGVTTSTGEDTAKVVTLTGHDVDGDSLSFVVQSGPSHGILDSFGSISCASGTCTMDVTYHPAANYHGPDQFTYSTDDGLLTSGNATVDITVSSINDAPVANDDSYSTNEDTQLVVPAPGVLDNDTDVDGNPLVASNHSNASHGSVSFNDADGSFTYTPAANYTGPDSFTYHANDGTAESAPATVNITVNAVNDAPVADAVSVTPQEDVPEVVGLTGNDPVEGSALTFSIFSGPSHGSLGSITGTSCPSSCSASVTYTPASNYNGPDSFTYRVFDGTTFSPPATVTITVSAVNDPPSFTKGADDQVVTSSGPRTVPGWATNISRGPADENGQTLNFVVSVPAADAGLFLVPPAIDATSGDLTYTPGAIPGSTTVTVTLHDNGGGADTSPPQTFVITVAPPNTAPSADGKIVSTNEDSAVVVTMSGDDPDGDALTFTIVTGPIHGALSAQSGPTCSAAIPSHCTATILYTPTGNYHGGDSFTYKTNDGLADSATNGTVTITVTQVNDTPTDIALSSASVAENQPTGTAIGTFSTTDTADPADTFTYTLETGAGSTGNPSFQIVGNELRTNASLNFEAQPSYSIRVRSTDNGTPNLFFEKQFTITVTNVNETPTDITLSPSTVAENEALGTDVGTLSTTDPDAGNTFAYSKVGGDASLAVSGGHVVVSSAIDFEATPTLSITVRTTDQGGLFFEELLTVTVTNVNEAPTDIGLTATSINENMPINSTVGTASTTDPDAANTFTYTLVTGAGSADNTSFNFNGAALRTSAVFNYEVKSSYSIRVKSADQGGLSVEKEFTITVVDVNDAPVAADDTFNSANANTDAIGNTKLAISVPGQPGPVKNGTGTALTGDTDEDTLPADTLTVAFPATSTHGTIVSGNADGTFVYLPNPGFVGTDTFNYTLSDGQGGTDTGQVSIEVDNMVWYVDSTVAGPGTGVSSDAYKSLSSLQGTDLDVATDTIFVYSGAYTTGIPLEASQKLWGQPNGLSVDGTTLVAAGGTNPVINASAGDGIGLANDVEVLRVNVGSATGVGIKGIATTNATVGPNTSVAGAAGGAVSLTGTATGTITIDSTIANTTGAAVTIGNRTGGTVSITGTVTDAGTGVAVSSNNATINLSGNITESGAGSLSFSSNTGGTTNLTGNLTTANGGVSASVNTGHTMSLTGILHLTGTGSTKAFSVTGGGIVKATATDNTASTVTGRAVEVANSTITTGGVNFKSVSAGNASSGPDSGIVLNNTGTTAGLTVAGTGSASTGGTIQKTTSHAVSLTTTDKVSLNWMNIQNAAHAGIKGAGVTDFTLTRTTINGVGQANTDPKDSSLAFNDTAGGINNNLDGVVVVTNNTLTNAYGGGVDVFNYNGTISDANVSNNTLTSSTAVASSKSGAIMFNLFGSGGTVASLTKATINTNTITNFPSGDGILLQGGNTSSAAAPSGTYGTPTGMPGTGSNIVTISGNTVQGDVTTKLNGQGISVAVAGRGQGNFNITGNGTVALPITHVKGSGIGVGIAGSVTADYSVTSNVINGTDNIVGSSALGIGTDTNIQADSSELKNPVLNIVVSNNTVVGSTGYGIQNLNRDSNGTTQLKMQNNSVTGPLEFGAIDVSSGNTGSVSYDPTICTQISGNTASTGTIDGFGDAEPGIQVEKWSTSTTTYVFGIVGLTPSPATAGQTETYLAAQNPASAVGVGFYVGKKAAVNIGSNFTSCTLGF
ncbi:MAG: large repetitive protein [Frankiaceae bacterium]|jgi:VCBS repeat-containing protein|nr:large repetitive protein [Frankiaceae bacterium]